MAFQSNSTMSYPPCDTYFEESADKTRDFAKIIASQRQDMMANELSRQAADDYLEDIMKHMGRMEVNGPGPLTSQHQC
jgi:hypothetical protein